MDSLLKRQREQMELLDRTLAQLDKEVSAHVKLKYAVMKIAKRNGVCWCFPHPFNPDTLEEVGVIHLQTCDAMYLALYGKERGK